MKSKPPQAIKVRSLLKLAIRNLTKQSAQTFLSVLAITLGVSLLVAGDLASSGYRSGFESAVDVIDLQQSFAFLFDIFETGLDAVGWAVLFTSGFLIYNSFSMAVARRTVQIGSLRALGSSQAQVVTCILIEALIVGVCGTALGFLLGYLLGQGLLALMGSAGFFSGKGSVSAVGTLQNILMGLGASTLAVLPAAIRAARIPPLEALKNQLADKGPKHADRTLSWVGLALILGIWSLLVVSPPGRWTLPPWNTRLPTYLSLLWLLGLGLTLPMIVETGSQLIGRWAKRKGGPAIRLAADNLNRERHRVVWTVITFMVGITMIVSLTGVLWFSLEGVLRRVSTSTTLLPRWLLTRGGAESEPSLEALAIQPGTMAEVEQLAAGRATVGNYYYVLAPEISTMFDHFPSLMIDPQMVLGPGGFEFTEGDQIQAQEIMQRGCGLLLTPGVAYRNGVSTGDSLPLLGEYGTVDCVVAGIGSGGFIYPTSFISLAAVDQFKITSGPNLVYVVSSPNTDRQDLERDLLALDDRLGSELEVSPVESALETVYELRETMSGFLGSLLILAVIGAGLGVLNTTMISLMERKRELGLLRAVGAARRQIYRIVGAEMLLTGLLGGLLGLLAGAGVSMIYVLSHGGNVYGLSDLPLWQAGWEATWPALKSSLLVALAIPAVCAGAAWIACRRALQGPPRETMQEIH